MKTPKIQKNTFSNSHSSKPFFNKSGEGSFFSPTNENEKPSFSPSSVQSKLTIGQPNDKYEQEADMMTEKVVKKTESPNSNAPIQRKYEDSEQEDKLQKKEEDNTEEMQVMRKPVFDSGDDSQIQTKSIESQLNTSKGKGSSLPKNTKSNMESAFGADFSSVKIHTDSPAVQMSKQLNAKAFTHGSDVYFNRGEYQPGSSEGKRLLGHELTHVVQQGRGGSMRDKKATTSISPISSKLELRRQPVVTPISPTDEKYALETGRRDAERIKKKGIGEEEGEFREQINIQLRFFEGKAYNVYANEIKKAYQFYSAEQEQSLQSWPKESPLSGWDFLNPIAHIDRALDRAGDRVAANFFQVFAVTSPIVMINGEVALRAYELEAMKKEHDFRVAVSVFLPYLVVGSFAKGIFDPLALHYAITHWDQTWEALKAAKREHGWNAFNPVYNLLLRWHETGEALEQATKTGDPMDVLKAVENAGGAVGSVLDLAVLPKLIVSVGRLSKNLIQRGRNRWGEPGSTEQVSDLGTDGKLVTNEGRGGRTSDPPPTLRAFASTDEIVAGASGAHRTLDEYLDALRAESHDAGSVGGKWDHFNQPTGLRNVDWEPGVPIDMPNPAGHYPVYTTARKRYWRSRAHFELEARAQGQARHMPGSTQDPVKGLDEAGLRQMVVDGKAPAYAYPNKPGQTWELEHVGVPQRVGKALEDLGFSKPDAARLTRASEPGNLLEVTPLEHAFLDGEAHSFGRLRGDADGVRWRDTVASDLRGTRPLYYMSDAEIETIVRQTRTANFNATPRALELRDHLRTEITQRGLSFTPP